MVQSARGFAPEIERVNRIDIDAGLRYRIRRAARQIGDQHRKLDEIYLVLGEAVADCAKLDACDAFYNYRDTVVAHFALEENIFFPAIHGLAPALERQLTELIDSHDRFRSDLAHMADELDGADPASIEDFSRQLHGFAKALAIHEGKEEKLVREVVDVSAH